MRWSTNGANRSSVGGEIKALAVKKYDPYWLHAAMESAA